MPRSHDDFIINGRWHKCVCGARYSDSDGGPCHDPDDEEFQGDDDNVDARIDAMENRRRR